MDKPKDAIERMREGQRWQSDISDILAWADSIPDDAVSVVWPAELTKRRLLDVSHALKADGHVHYAQIVDALAAIAPHTKRKCELWIHERGQKEWLYSDDKWTAHRANMPGWRCVARNVELED